METRLYNRFNLGATCSLVMGDKMVEHKVLNISVGGMLVEKDNDCVYSVGDNLPCSIKFADCQLDVTSVVLRIQERSVALKFDLSKMQKETLNRQIRKR